MMDKQQKYDRQLRLWGDHGQKALENSKICLVNVTAIGTEILKNIILPGIGSFTIVDGCCLTGEDVGNNFFLNHERIGESRAKVATEMLLELNPDVTGEYVDENVNQLIISNPQYFFHFSAVIVSGVNDTNAVLKLADILWKENIPLILCKSYGFLGYARLVVSEHCIVESHPDNVHEDLRLDQPFSTFTDFCDSLDLDSMTYKEHSHTPYIVVLYKCLQKWKLEKGSFPITWKEKNEFKKTILAGVREKVRAQGGVDEDEENFLEAIRHANASLVPSIIPSQVQEILDDPKSMNIEESSSNFWILVKGLRRFVENQGNHLLPLRGTLPDMTSDSDRYIHLQSIYKQRAEQDVNAVLQHVSDVCASLNAGNGRVSESEVKRFCKNAHFLRLIRCQSLSEEYSSPAKSVVECMTSDPDSNAAWYIMFRAIEKFQMKHGRNPGTHVTQVEADIGRLKTCSCELLEEWGVPGASELVKDDYVHEICRCGAAELHAVASYMGGVIAQEIIKLVTAQYVPFTDVFIYNGLNCTTMTLKM